MADDLARCRALLRQGSRSFYAASLLLPPRVRHPAAAVYAFCRVADDAVDRRGADAHCVARLEDRLDRVFAGDPEAHPVDRALCEVVRAHGLPRAAFDALLEGFRWDVTGRRYATLDELEDYCARVAGSVGTLMTVLMGERSQEVLARGAEMGVAMQLTNIARDVGEDARSGRLYLPVDWMEEAGVDVAEWMARPRFSWAVGSVVARLLGRAERVYGRADAGVAGLPRDCRPAIRAARLVYADIGRAIGAERLRQRFGTPVQLDAAQGVAHRALGAGRCTAAGRGLGRPPLEAVRFLVDATAR